MYKSNLSRDGFTIVELLVVIVVIGILAAITLVSYSGISRQAITASLKSDLVSSVRLLKIHQTDYGNYPSEVRCDIPESANNKCLKLSSNNQIDQYVGTSQSFTLKLKNGTIKYAISDNSQPGEVVALTGIAAISGTPQRAQTLTAGSLSHSGAVATYQWQRCTTTSTSSCLDISGANSNTYKPTSDDVGKYLRVLAIGQGFTDGSANSTLSAIIQQAPTTTINGSNPTNGGAWGLHAYWDAGLDLLYDTTSSTFNLSSFPASSGTLTDVSIVWNNASSSAAFSGIGRSVKMNSPSTTICTLPESGVINTCTSGSLANLVNSKRGTTFMIDWDISYTGIVGPSMGDVSWHETIQSPRLVFVWETN